MSIVDSKYIYKTEDEYNKLLFDYEHGTLKGTPKESLIINPKVAYHVSESDILKSIPLSELRRNKDIYGTISVISKRDPVSNLLWDYLFFVDSSIFQPAANTFRKTVKDSKKSKLKPAYTRHIPGTRAYEKFWEIEYARILNGYEPEVNGKPCGLRISGEFYFYLNYGWMQKLEFNDEGEVIKDNSDLPDFLAMDYYYYKELESRENPKKFGLPIDWKKSMTITKSRRKGFSYKAASGSVWITAFKNRKKVLIASVQGKDATLCFKKAMDIIDHLTKYTPFGRKNPGNPSTNGGWKHITMSLKDDSGRFTFGLQSTKTTERKGRLSEIVTASLFNKPDAASGEGLARLYIEEAGKILNLGKAWRYSLESMRVGSVYRSGIAIVFGTGGSMVTDTGKKGSSKDFSYMHYNPEANFTAAYDNIYDLKVTNKKCGYFVSDMWSNFGSRISINGQTYLGLDKNGNPFFWVAEAALNKDRLLIKPPNGDKADFELFLTQRCKTPREAFYVTQGSIFQTEDLYARQELIKLSKLGFENRRMPGELIERGDGFLEFIPKPDLEPIVTRSDNNSDKEGCLLRYEKPIKINGRVPDGAYIISVDPIGQNTSSGKSKTAIIVYKTNRYEDYMGQEKIVATYYGRKSNNPQLYVQRLLLKLSKYYNALITVENDRDGGIPQFFITKGEVARLMNPPVMTMEKNKLGKSVTNLRKFGHSTASRRHKIIAESLIYEWLDKRGSRETFYDTEEGEKIIHEGKRNLDNINDELLLEELISYDRDNNFDMVSALAGIVLQLKEWYDDDDEINDTLTISSELEDWHKKRYDY